MSTNLEGFEPVFGEGQGGLETAVPHALLPFLFYIHALDSTRLRFEITDFHSNTWQALKTTDQLEELRDEVGIGGSWQDFVSYLGAAFSSNNVKLILGGPVNSVGGYGATSAKLTTQKSKGMPRISIFLEKLAEPLASDIKGNISMELFKVFKQKSDALVAEQRHTFQLTGTLAAEKEKIEKLQKQLDAFSFASKKRGHKATSSHSLYPSMLDTTVVPSQLDTKTATVSQTQMPAGVMLIRMEFFSSSSSSGGNVAYVFSASETQKSQVLGKPATSRSKVRVAPASHRVKQRGAHLADAED